MSGENRRNMGWLLPVIVVGVGAYFLYAGMRQGTLQPVSLKPVQWAGIGVMAAGVVAVLLSRKRKLMKLAGVLVCGIGAIMVICL